MVNRMEMIQQKAIKWILNEEKFHYNDYEYYRKLQDLDILPINEKFDYTDLSVFL